jgi:DNA/RNA non-specific endonuclease
MTPSGDMPDERSQYDTFSLANLVPQEPKNNRGIWEGIESAVRQLAEKRGELYVITGPLFVGSSVQQLNGRVLVANRRDQLNRIAADGIFPSIYDHDMNEPIAVAMLLAVGQNTRRFRNSLMRPHSWRDCTVAP